ncbi:MAG: hypothetical protein ACYCPW_05675 [Nitrososphaerales archaeon]
MAFKLGSVNHAKGFILNKLFEQHRVGGKHIAMNDLVTGYPKPYRNLLVQAVEDLKKEGLVVVQPKRTGRDSGDHVTLVWNQLPKARALLNGFREEQLLPRLGKDLKSFIPVK